MRRVTVLVLLLATGCGGSNGAATDSKAAYLGRAEAICAKANAQVAQAKKQQPTDVAAVPAYVHRLVGIARQDVQELSALTPPKQDAAQIQAKVLEPLARQLAAADAFAAQVDAAAKRNDSAALFALVTHPPTKAQVDLTWMKSYGFTGCLQAVNPGAGA